MTRHGRTRNVFKGVHVAIYVVMEAGWVVRTGRRATAVAGRPWYDMMLVLFPPDTDRTNRGTNRAGGGRCVRSCQRWGSCRRRCCHQQTNPRTPRFASPARNPDRLADEDSSSLYTFTRSSCREPERFLLEIHSFSLGQQAICKCITCSHQFGHVLFFDFLFFYSSY